MLRKVIPLILFAGLTALLIMGLQQADQKNIIDSPLIGKPAPKFNLIELNTQAQVQSSDLQGQPYLLNVWASWCPGCQTEHNVISTIATSNEVTVIGLNYKDDPADAKRWLQQFGDPYAMILVDTNGRTGIEYGVYGAPETFLIDANGTIIFKHVGILTNNVWQQQILPLLKNGSSDSST